ncbi:acyltransferase family protein [Sphingobium olei]|uniref:Acyltransferase family protein n=1 Tax=Sphingobium olei TaxID=420955 RepID=A0ABW3P260_9SPHN|nr:acyltransferase [Sphingobium sp.]
MQKSRIHAFDYIRATCIMLVVIYHVLLSINDSGVPVPAAIMEVNRALSTVRMPVFFFVSGILFHLVFEQGKSDFWRNLVVGLAIPYLAWSFVQGVGKMMMPGSTANPVTGSDLLAILWAPIDHFWFIYALIVARLVGRLDDRKGYVILAVFVASLAFYYLTRVDLMPKGLWSSLTRGLTYFIGGLWFARHYNIDLLKAPSLRAATIRFAVAAIAFICVRYIDLAFLMPRLPLLAGVAQTIVEPALGIYAAITLSLSLPAPTSLGGRCAALVAQGSLVIYLMNPMVAAVSRSAMIKAGMDHWLLLFIAVLAITTMVPVTIYLVANRLRLLPYLALGPNRRIPRAAPASA